MAKCYEFTDINYTGVCMVPAREGLEVPLWIRLTAKPSVIVSSGGNAEFH